jgi:RHS repeat-associated protein
MGLALGALAPGALAQTAVSLNAPPNNALYALPTTITLKAAASATSPASVARVEFYANGSLIGTDTTRAFSFAWTNPAPGTYSLTAIAYDSAGDQAVSAARTVTVAAGNQPPTVNLTAPANNSVFALPATVTLKASAAAPETNDTVAKVDFFANGVLIGTDTSRAFSLAWTPSEGTYTLTAVATDGLGAQTTSAARTITVAVNQAPTVRLTSPANNAKFVPPATIELKASAAAPEDNDTVARVDFFANGVLIGSDASKANTFTWTEPAPGSYMLTAVATDGQGAQTSSVARTITVEAANLPPTVHLTSPANGAVLNAPAAIELKAAASAPEANDSVVRVDFFDGATLVGTATAAPYVATIAAALAGTHVLTAVATDAQGAQTVSAARTVTVNAAAVAQMYFIATDHLNTPRMIADQNTKVVWRWDQGEPFGDSLPDDDPDGDGVAFEFPLRFPGQYFDGETRLAYNYFRDYDAALGRYIQVDPIGLRGGPNLYLYVRGHPNGGTDLQGLFEVNPADFPIPQRDPGTVSNYGSMECGDGECGVDPETLLEITIGAASLYPATRAAGACYKVAKKIQDPCKNAILAAALGASICAGKPPGQFPRDRERTDQIRTDSEQSGQQQGVVGKRGSP